MKLSNKNLFVKEYFSKMKIQKPINGHQKIQDYLKSEAKERSIK